MAEIKIRGEVVRYAALVERAMKLRVDRLDLAREADSSRIAQAMRQQCEQFIDLVDELETKGNPKVSIEAIVQKSGHVGALALAVVLALHHRMALR